MVLRLETKGSPEQDFLCKLGFGIYCIVTCLGDLIDKFVPDKLMLVPYVLVVGLLVLGAPFSLKVKPLKKILVFYVFIVFFVLIRNVHLQSTMQQVKWWLGASMLILLPQCPKHLYVSFLRILGCVTFVNVFFTYFFWLLPGKYPIMYRVWGKWPTGTNNGTAGFHAGIDNHYSQNAMVIALCLIVIASLYISYAQQKEKRKTICIVLAVFVLIGLILTNKRAHLLFGFAAVMFGYLVSVPEHRVKSTLKVVLICIVSVALFVLLAQYVPFMGELLERFSTSGEDDNTTVRFQYWKLALDNFREHPLLGIGWDGFQIEYHEHLYSRNYYGNDYPYMNAHNVYCQLLCECGLVGTLMYISSAVSWFVMTLRLLKKKLRRLTSEYGVVMFSIVMQTFFYMYCVTGNCLYDRMFLFYTIAVGMAIGISTQKDVLDTF